MDRNERAANVVRELYKYKRSENPATFIKEVCRYFDSVKNFDLTPSDANFLIFLANEAGVPQYYDLLEEKYGAPVVQDNDITLLALGAHIHDRSLLVNIDNNVKHLL